MNWFCLLIFLSAFYPIYQGILHVRATTLVYAMCWAALAWIGWLCSLVHWLNPQSFGVPVEVLSYVGLSLTGCAGVSVLGARRPIHGPWNLVILGMAAVMFLPLLEQAVIGTPSFEWLRLVFVAGTIAVLIVNYLPTRLLWATLLLAAGCAWEYFRVVNAMIALPPMSFSPGLLSISLVPWVAWLSWRRRIATKSEFDRVWLNFRDSFGLVWGQRTREQFHRAVDHAGWPVRLDWSGLVIESQQADRETPTRVLEILQSLLKRFGV